MRAAPTIGALALALVLAARPAWAGPSVGGFLVSGFVQGQYESSQASEDQLAQGGAHLNQDAFSVRRGRLVVERRWEHAAADLELEANTVRTTPVTLRRAEGTLFYGGTEDLPLVALSAGLGDIPFGHELTEPTRARWFMERSAASQALFPGEADAGVRIWGGARFLRYALAAQNGEIGSGRGGLGDANASKDLVLRVGAEAAQADAWKVGFGVSVLSGQGFHPGKSATKDSIEWRDLDEDGAIDTGELVSIPGIAATPSANFAHWALGADLEVDLTTRAGETHVAFEVAVASNLDRGLFVADPVAAGIDIRHLGVTGQVVQTIGRYGFAGLRVDRYDPLLDSFDARGGKLIPTDSSITTIAPLLGARLPWHARAWAQYDVVIDHLGRDDRGVPTDLRDNRWTVRLQVDL